jgi:hypothetical protein
MVDLEGKFQGNSKVPKYAAPTPTPNSRHTKRQPDEHKKLN